jgi:hypothetical protein
MSNLSSSGGAAVALIEPPINTVPSASDIADVIACRAGVLLLEVLVITVSL